MAKKTPPAAAEDEAPAEGGRKKLVLVALVVVALAIGGYITVSGGGDADAAETATEPAAPVAGDVVTLEPITLNLSDGRFLKVGLALQLVEGVAAPAPADVAGFAAPALDDSISLLGGLSYADLVAPGGRDAAKQALSERIAARYEGDVMGVYFTELVMQ